MSERSLMLLAGLVLALLCGLDWLGLLPNPLGPETRRGLLLLGLLAAGFALLAPHGVWREAGDE